MKVEEIQCDILDRLFEKYKRTKYMIQKPKKRSKYFKIK